ncbi:MAG: hypothetical protein JSV86_06280 [Gemmatimonadota bacterium]|nr:MAG: hypothetical protein JSV86_06280 [Gemmatimonadota bacterium]
MSAQAIDVDGFTVERADGYVELTLVELNGNRRVFHLVDEGALALVEALADLLICDCDDCETAREDETSPADQGCGAP